MSIQLEPTMIKQSVYLLVPKSIASLLELDENSLVSLSIKKIDDENVLEYKISKTD